MRSSSFQNIAPDQSGRLADMTVGPKVPSYHVFEHAIVSELNLSSRLLTGGGKGRCHLCTGQERTKDVATTAALVEDIQGIHRNGFGPT